MKKKFFLVGIALLIPFIFINETYAEYTLSEKLQGSLVAAFDTSETTIRVVNDVTNEKIKKIISKEETFIWFELTNFEGNDINELDKDYVLTLKIKANLKDIEEYLTIEFVDEHGEIIDIEKYGESDEIELGEKITVYKSHIDGMIKKSQIFGVKILWNKDEYVGENAGNIQESFMMKLAIECKGFVCREDNCILN